MFAAREANGSASICSFAITFRADREARDAYARLKQDLADRYRDDRLAYNEGKTGFILDMLSEAEAWATATGWAVPPAQMPDRPGTDTG